MQEMSKMVSRKVFSDSQLGLHSNVLHVQLAGFVQRFDLILHTIRKILDLGRAVIENSKTIYAVVIENSSDYLRCGAGSAKNAICISLCETLDLHKSGAISLTGRYGFTMTGT